jgi:hypothetical protein
LMFYCFLYLVLLISIDQVISNLTCKN